MEPMIYEDLILIGPAGSENAISGWVGAFRLADGIEVWRFKTVPGVDAANSESWKNPTHIKIGGGAVWTPMSLDLEKGELYVAVTNPAPDLPAGLRPGDNRYSDSIVALDIRTGKLNWYKQTIPNDSHDWDLSQVSPIFSAEVNGQRRDLFSSHSRQRWDLGVASVAVLVLDPPRIGAVSSQIEMNTIVLWKVRTCRIQLGNTITSPHEVGVKPAMPQSRDIGAVQIM